MLFDDTRISYSLPLSELVSQWLLFFFSLLKGNSWIGANVMTGRQHDKPVSDKWVSDSRHIAGITLRTCIIIRDYGEKHTVTFCAQVLFEDNNGTNE